MVTLWDHDGHLSRLCYTDSALRGGDLVGAHPRSLAPPALKHIVRKCLAKDPEERWQDARDVASELKCISETGSQPHAAQKVILRKNRERIVFASLVLLLAALSTFLCAIRKERGPALTALMKLLYCHRRRLSATATSPFLRTAPRLPNGLNGWNGRLMT